jgi:50S ribosomal protein L16 3-hydroxylase
MDLDDLLQPISSQQFLRAYWEKQHLAIAGPLERFGDGVTSLASLSVENLVDLGRSASEPVSVWFQTVEREHRTLELSAPTAMQLYAAGMTIYSSFTTTELRAWLLKLERSLGRKPGSSRSHIFASRERTGTQAHFDQNENFTIQLRGKKRWRISYTPHIVAPISNWVTGQQVPLWLRQASPEGLPRGTLENASVVELEPGHVLYVPAGVWHETETSHDSVSLNINLTAWQGRWLDIIRALVDSIMMSEPSIREYATGIWRDDARTQLEHQQLDSLLQRTADRLALVRAEHVWGPPSDGAASASELTDVLRLRRNPLAYVCIVGRTPEKTLLDVCGPVARKEIAVSDDVALLLPWMHGTNTSFTAVDALGALKGGANVQAEALALLTQLLQLGYLTGEAVAHSEVVAR